MRKLGSRGREKPDVVVVDVVLVFSPCSWTFSDLSLDYRRDNASADTE